MHKFAIAFGCALMYLVDNYQKNKSQQKAISKCKRRKKMACTKWSMMKDGAMRWTNEAQTFWNAFLTHIAENSHTFPIYTWYLYLKISKMNLNSTWLDIPTLPIIWPFSAHSLGLPDKRYHFCHVQCIKICKTAKLHWIWNGLTPNIVTFDPQYLVSPGLPNLAFAIFIQQCMINHFRKF